MESFLAKLQNRRCNFRVLWFDDHESLLLPGRVHEGTKAPPEQQYAQATVFQKRRLARAILIRHLEQFCQQMTPPTELCFRFSSMDSEEFASYRKHTPIRLFFVSDGQAVSMCDNMGKPSVPDETPMAHVGTGMMTFQSIIYRLSTAGYTVGLLDDIEFHSSEVSLAFVISVRHLSPSNVR